MNYLQHFNIYLALIILFLCKFSTSENNYCYSKKENCDNNKSKTNFRYLLYDINFIEGFNFRRDVYLRFAVLANNLKHSGNPDFSNFKLVLPPWSHLLHWTPSSAPEHIPWAYFFDVKSLQAFAPVIEMSDFFDVIKNNNNRYYNKVNIEEVYILQDFEKVFDKTIDRFKIDKCQKKPYVGFYFYNNITSDNVRCLSFHGYVLKLKELLSKSKAKYILIDHAEKAINRLFGDKTYWKARRSMRFNKDLRKIASEFRRQYLNSTDDGDRTVLPENWLDEKAKRSAVGGPYLAVHLRRKDYVWARPSVSPDLTDVSQQIKRLLVMLKLETVFIATDAPENEFLKLKSLLEGRNVLRYIADNKTKLKYKDGGIAIIEQIICSYGRYFIGTHESTFTFVIQEEREILGFPVQMTFNRLCKKNSCDKYQWKIIH